MTERETYHIPFEEYNLLDLAKLSKCLSVLVLYLKVVYRDSDGNIPLDLDFNASVLQTITQRQFKQAYLILSPIVRKYLLKNTEDTETKARLLASINFKVNLLDFCYCYFWLIDNVLEEDHSNVELVDFELLLKFPQIFNVDINNGTRSSQPTYKLDPILGYFSLALEFKYNKKATFPDLQKRFESLLSKQDYEEFAKLEAELVSKKLVAPNSLFGVKLSKEPLDMSDLFMVKDNVEWAYDTYETSKLQDFYKLLDFYATKFLHAWVSEGALSKEIVTKYVKPNAVLAKNLSHWQKYLGGAKSQRQKDAEIASKKAQVYKSFAKKHPHIAMNNRYDGDDEEVAPENSLYDNLRIVMKNCGFFSKYGVKTGATLAGLIILLAGYLWRKKGVDRIKKIFRR